MDMYDELMMGMTYMEERDGYGQYGSKMKDMFMMFFEGISNFFMMIFGTYKEPEHMMQYKAMGGYESLSTTQYDTSMMGYKMFGGQGQGYEMLGFKGYDSMECEARMQVVSMVAGMDMGVNEVNMMSFGAFPFFNYDMPEEMGWSNWFMPAMDTMDSMGSM